MTNPSPVKTPLFAQLLPQHAKILSESGISENIARERGYWSETNQAALSRLGFARSQCVTPCLVAPLRNLDGEIVSYQIRADMPRIVAGKPAKYENPKGSRLPIDVPLAVQTQIFDRTVPLFVAVGVRQADAAVSKGSCCIALLSIHGWKNQEPLWNRIPLEQREVYIVTDSRVADNAPAAKEAADLFAFLTERSANVRSITLPPGPNGQKVALDNYLAAGHPAGGLVSLAVASPPKPPESQNSREKASGPYEANDEGIFKITITKDGESSTRLTNFDARIVAEIEFENGGRFDREFEISVRMNGEEKTVYVLASEYEEMKWVITKVGAGARIEEGFNNRDASRAAIQWLSAPIPVLRGIRSLGWHCINDEFVFVHAGGVISADSVEPADCPGEDRSDVTGWTDRNLRHVGPKRPISQAQGTAYLVCVRIPEVLSGYRLPDPSTGSALKEDIQKSMALLKFGPLHVTVPLYAAIWRAIFDATDFSVSVNGTTGQGKTERASLYLQHFGAELDSRNPLTTWRDTDNYRIAVMAAARHVLAHVDDLVLEGPRAAINRTYEAAARFFRGHGNAAGRGRCNNDGSPRAPAPPQGLPISTGEDSLPGPSLNARIVNIDLPQDEAFDLTNPDTSMWLATFQDHAKEGAYARVMSAFLKWLAPQLEEKRRQMYEQAAEYRKELFLAHCSLSRTATAMGELLASLEIFFEFLLHIDFLDGSEHEDLWELVHDGLYASADQQREHHTEEDPAHRFLDLLATALATGYAHLVYLVDDEEPDV